MALHTVSIREKVTEQGIALSERAEGRSRQAGAGKQAGGEGSEHRVQALGPSLVYKGQRMKGAKGQEHKGSCTTRHRERRTKGE